MTVIILEGLYYPDKEKKKLHLCVCVCIFKLTHIYHSHTKLHKIIQKFQVWCIRLSIHSKSWNTAHDNTQKNSVIAEIIEYPDQMTVVKGFMKWKVFCVKQISNYFDIPGNREIDL